MATNNYIDYAKGADLVKPVSTLLDLEESQTAGSLLSFMRLEQINDHQTQLTAYLSEGTWGALFLPSSGLVGESRFLISGTDLKSRINFEPWTSNPLRLKATKRKDIRVECLLNVNQNFELVDNIESPLYSGSFSEFTLNLNHDWDEDSTGVISDGITFRRRAGILNTFSKYQNDTNHRYVWFHVESGKLMMYGSEYTGGDAGISLIKIGLPIEGPAAENAEGLSFSIPARHLSRMLHLIEENNTINFRVTKDRDYVQFWSVRGWFIFPCQEPQFNRTLSVNAPAYLGNKIVFTKSCQRVFCAQELNYKVAMQKKKTSNDPDGIRLECTDAYLVLTKVGDKLRREVSHSLFAEPAEGEDWSPIVVYQQHFIRALTAALKFCRQLKDEELYESGYTYDEYDVDEDIQENDDYLFISEDLEEGSTTLVTLTQQYIENKDSWCLFIDPVPYVEECTVFVAASTPGKLDDWSEDNV